MPAPGDAHPPHPAGEMDLHKIASQLHAIQADASLHKEINLGARAKALDLIALVQEIAHLQGAQGDVELLNRQAMRLKQRLQAIDTGLFAELRARIRSGECTASELRSTFNSYTKYTPRRGQVHAGYDALDLLVEGLFTPAPVPQPTRAADSEMDSDMVHLEPTPARAILDLADHVGMTTDDVFFDLGSGLGQVVLIVHLLTGVWAKGIEVEPAYCAYARAQAQELGLSGVAFVRADARHIDLAGGTIFFMFTPFKGKLLRQVLERLRCQALTRSLRICTFGPCTLHVAQEGWLRSVDEHADHEFKLALFATK